MLFRSRLGEGRDFYMQPAWNGEGARLAWVEWDHPNMPWDGTELRVAGLAFPEGGLPFVTNSRVVAGGPGTSIFQPTFGKNGELLYVSGETGWGHVHSLDLATGEVRQVTSGEGEFGQAAWAQGQRSYAVLADGTVVCVRSQAGFDTLHLARGAAPGDVPLARDRKSTRLNSSHIQKSRMPSSA